MTRCRDSAPVRGHPPTRRRKSQRVRSVANLVAPSAVLIVHTVDLGAGPLEEGDAQLLMWVRDAEWVLFNCVRERAVSVAQRGCRKRRCRPDRYNGVRVEASCGVRMPFRTASVYGDRETKCWRACAQSCAQSCAHSEIHKECISLPSECPHVVEHRQVSAACPFLNCLGTVPAHSVSKTCAKQRK